MSNSIGLQNQIKQLLLTKDWKICTQQDSATCLVAEHKSHFKGRICKQCFILKNHKYYTDHKAVLNSNRVVEKRKKREAVREKTTDLNEERVKSTSVDDSTKIA